MSATTSSLNLQRRSTTCARNLDEMASVCCHFVADGLGDVLCLYNADAGEAQATR